jgi:hypothetical protein
LIVGIGVSLAADSSEMRMLSLRAPGLDTDSSAIYDG